MGTPSLTKRLRRAASRGQELVTLNGVPVTHEARSGTDPRPWVTAAGHTPQTRHSASECMARLALPLPAGTVLEHTHSRKRGLYSGPAVSHSFVIVEFGGWPMTVSRNLLRLVTS